MATCIYKFNRYCQVVLQKVASLNVFTTMHEHSFPNQAPVLSTTRYLLTFGGLHGRKLQPVTVLVCISFLSSEVQYLLPVR